MPSHYLNQCCNIVNSNLLTVNEWHNMQIYIFLWKFHKLWGYSFHMVGRFGPYELYLLPICIGGIWCTSLMVHQLWYTGPIYRLPCANEPWSVYHWAQRKHNWNWMALLNVVYWNENNTMIQFPRTFWTQGSFLLIEFPVSEKDFVEVFF